MNGTPPESESHQATGQRDVSSRADGSKRSGASDSKEPHPPSVPRPGLPINWRTGMMYGAALGMLAGLIWQAVAPLESIDSIVRWRNTILAGAALGLLIALICRLTRKAH